jgi:hypothetical protein
MYYTVYYSTCSKDSVSKEPQFLNPLKGETPLWEILDVEANDDAQKYRRKIRVAYTLAKQKAEEKTNHTGYILISNLTEEGTKIQDGRAINSPLESIIPDFSWEKYTYNRMHRSVANNHQTIVMAMGLDQKPTLYVNRALLTKHLFQANQKKKPLENILTYFQGALGISEQINLQFITQTTNGIIANEGAAISIQFDRDLTNTVITEINKRKREEKQAAVNDHQQPVKSENIPTKVEPTAPPLIHNFSENLNVHQVNVSNNPEPAPYMPEINPEFESELKNNNFNEHETPSAPPFAPSASSNTNHKNKPIVESSANANVINMQPSTSTSSPLLNNAHNLSLEEKPKATINNNFSSNNYAQLPPNLANTKFIIDPGSILLKHNDQFSDSDLKGFIDKLGRNSKSSKESSYQQDAIYFEKLKSELGNILVKYQQRNIDWKICKKQFDEIKVAFLKQNNLITNYIENFIKTNLTNSKDKGAKDAIEAKLNSYKFFDIGAEELKTEFNKITGYDLDLQLKQDDCIKDAKGIINRLQEKAKVLTSQDADAATEVNNIVADLNDFISSYENKKAIKEADFQEHFDNKYDELTNAYLSKGKDTLDKISKYIKEITNNILKESINNHVSKYKNLLISEKQLKNEICQLIKENIFLNENEKDAINTTSEYITHKLKPKANQLRTRTFYKSDEAATAMETIVEQLETVIKQYNEGVIIEANGFYAQCAKIIQDNRENIDKARTGIRHKTAEKLASVFFTKKDQQNLPAEDHYKTKSTQLLDTLLNELKANFASSNNLIPANNNSK